MVFEYSFSGPTSYGPIVDAAADIVERSGGQFHVLVIVADGQVLFLTVLSWCICCYSTAYTKQCVIVLRLQEVLIRRKTHSVLMKKVPLTQSSMQGTSSKFDII